MRDVGTALSAHFIAPFDGATSSPSGRIEVGTQCGPYINQYTSQDREFFAKYYKLLHLEGLEGERQQTLLWQTSLRERVERGTAICYLVSLDTPVPTGQGEWRQTSPCTNTSGLPEWYEILLSDW